MDGLCLCLCAREMDGTEVHRRAAPIYLKQSLKMLGTVCSLLRSDCALFQFVHSSLIRNKLVIQICLLCFIHSFLSSYRFNCQTRRTRQGGLNLTLQLAYKASEECGKFLKNKERIQASTKLDTHRRLSSALICALSQIAATQIVSRTYKCPRYAHRLLFPNLELLDSQQASKRAFGRSVDWMNVCVCVCVVLLLLLLLGGNPG